MNLFEIADRAVMNLYKAIQKQLPKTHRLCFGITTYTYSDTNETENKVTGFIHTSETEIYHWTTIEELKKYINNREILFRSFRKEKIK